MKLDSDKLEKWLTERKNTLTNGLNSGHIAGIGGTMAIDGALALLDQALEALKLGVFTWGKVEGLKEIQQLYCQQKLDADKISLWKVGTDREYYIGTEDGKVKEFDNVDSAIAYLLDAGCDQYQIVNYEFRQGGFVVIPVTLWTMMDYACKHKKEDK